MTHPTINRRLAKIESRRGFSGDIAYASDAQLHAFIRSAYGDLRTEHGNLALAAEHLRGTGCPDDAALAVVILEDIGGADARYH